MNKEAFVISQFTSKYIGDDGAVVGEQVFSKDIFAEGIHFKREWFTLTQIARKSMLVNLSDAVAMNAVPKYALIGVTIPKTYGYEELKELSLAFEATCKEWGVELIGGDTTSGSHLVISITIISYTKNPIFRKGMKEGHLVAYTGKVGDSLKELRYLLSGGKTQGKKRFCTPNLKSDFFYKAAPYVSVALDLSDGLGKDLSRLCEVNNLGVKFTCKVTKQELCSGEEYEMLFSFHPKYKERILSFAKQTRTPVRIVARAVRGKYKNPCKEHHL